MDAKFKFMEFSRTAMQLCPTLYDSMDGSLSGSSVHGILQARILDWVAFRILKGSLFPSPGNLPNPGIKLRSLALQADSLPAEPQRKPRVGI